MMDGVVACLSIWPEYLECPPPWPIIEFDLFIHASQGLIMAYTRIAVLHYGLDSYLRLPMQHFKLVLYLKDGDFIQDGAIIQDGEMVHDL